jgi:hypothetical protein
MPYALLHSRPGPSNTPVAKRAQQAEAGQRLKATPLALIQRSPVREAQVEVGQHGVAARGHRNFSRLAAL